MLTDEQFVGKLREYLAQFSEGEEPMVPVMENEDKTVNREKTLELIAYDKMDKSIFNV